MRGTWTMRVKCPERIAAEIRTHKHSTLRPYTSLFPHSVSP